MEEPDPLASPRCGSQMVLAPFRHRAECDPQGLVPPHRGLNPRLLFANDLRKASPVPTFAQKPETVDKTGATPIYN
jgi:hypothetical protein